MIVHVKQCLCFPFTFPCTFLSPFAFSQYLSAKENFCILFNSQRKVYHVHQTAKEKLQNKEEKKKRKFPSLKMHKDDEVSLKEKEGNGESFEGRQSI